MAGKFTIVQSTIVALGLLLVGYATFVAFSTNPLEPIPDRGTVMALEILIIGPAAIVGGLLIVDGLRRFRPVENRWLWLVLYPVGISLALLIPATYLLYSPNYGATGPLRGMFYLAIFLGVLAGSIVVLRFNIRASNPD